MDLVTGQLLAFVMVLTRVSAFFAIGPIFSWQGLPARVKIALAMFFSAFIAMQMKPVSSDYQLSATLAAITLINEVIYGMALGLIANILFATVRMFGRIAETQMGLNMSQIFDPISGEQSQPMSMMIELCFILMFLAAHGHHGLLMIISNSYDNFPLGQIPTIDTLLQGVVTSGTVMLTAALKLSAPIMAAFIFMLIVLAIFARIAPEMNILFLSMPVRVAVGLTMAAVFVPYTQGFVKELMQYMQEIIPL